MQRSTQQMGLNHKTSSSNIAICLEERTQHYPNWLNYSMKNLFLKHITNISIYLNYQMSETYRRYNDIVPHYLRERPRQVIIHCLERKSSSKKYTEDDVLTKDVKMGKFTIQGSGKVHTIDFGVATGKPTCTCPDWLQWQIPCKHFFSIFRLVEGWGWNALPDTYKTSAYLCSDSKALSEQQQLPQFTVEETNTEHGTSTSIAETNRSLQDGLPTKKVRYMYIHVHKRVCM